MLSQVTLASLFLWGGSSNHILFNHILFIYDVKTPNELMDGESSQSVGLLTDSVTQDINYNINVCKGAEVLHILCIRCKGVWSNPVKNQL